jgi:hypothetical protein
VSYDFSTNPHSYIHVLTDEIKFPFRIETKGLIKKKQYFVEFPNTIELINDGIRKYGNAYVGTYDHFYFKFSESVSIISKTSYDELVKVYRWRHEKDTEKTDDYGNITYFGKNTSKDSILGGKLSHIGLELTTFYPTSSIPLPDSDERKKVQFQIGPPPELIGPDGKPFGNFMSRLIFDQILIFLHLIYVSKDKKLNEKMKKTVEELIESTKI